MFVERTIVETDAKGRLKKIPDLPPNKRFETIFLVIGESESETPTTKREPCRDLKDSIKIHGNILDSAPEELWNLPQ